MLATTCPHCNTPFRVISDQLKLRSGLVRCGSCNEVFNALEHLSYVDQGSGDDDTLTRAQDGGDFDTRFADHQTTYVSDGIAPDTEARSDDKPLFERVSFDDAPATPAAGKRTIESADALQGREPSQSSALSHEKGGKFGEDAAIAPPTSYRSGPTSPNDTPDEAAARSAGFDAGYGRFEGPIASEGSLLATQSAHTGHASEAAASAASYERNERDGGLDHEGDSVSADASLLATAPTLLADEPEPDPTPRWVWIAAGLIGLALLVHALIAFRNPLAQAIPGLQGTLTAMCKPLGCTLAAPRMPEMITIESVDLQQDAKAPGRYLLQTVVRNRAPVAVALPALELTMSNALGQPELRRVFQPAEYLTPALGLTDRLLPKSEVILRIPFEAQRVDAVNYGVIIFYP